MRYSYEFSQQEQLVTIKLVGEISALNLIEVFKEVIHHADFHVGYNILTDYRLAEPMFNYGDSEILAEFIASLARNTRDYRSAVVMKDETDVYLAEIWSQHGHKIPAEEFRVFTDFEEAHQWVTEKH